MSTFTTTWRTDRTRWQRVHFPCISAGIGFSLPVAEWSGTACSIRGSWWSGDA